MQSPLLRLVQRHNVSVQEAKAKKLNEYQSVMKSFGGLGLARKQLLRIYEELSFLEQKQIKKEIKSLKKKKGEKDATFQKRVRAAANKLIKEPSRALSGRRVALNPKHKRKNPRRRKNALAMKKNKAVGSFRGILDKAGKAASKIPVVGKIAGVVTFVAGLTGYSVVMVHRTLEPVCYALCRKDIFTYSIRR